MKASFNYLILISYLVCTLGQAQDRKLKKAEDRFENYAFIDAIDAYENLVEKGYSELEIFKRLGDANYLNARYAEAASWYAKLLETTKTDIADEYIFRYAQALKTMQKYQKADSLLQGLAENQSGEVRTLNYLENTDYLDKIRKRSGGYSIRNLDINSPGSDFAPSYRGDQLIFATARDTGTVFKNIHQWNQKPFLNLYKAQITADGKAENPQSLSDILNTKTHESSAAFTKDGKTVYFTRNNSANGNFERDPEGVSRLKIYRATTNDSGWGNIEELPFNSDSYSVAHPALNALEDKLYFASDMPGSLGKSDLFVVTIQPDGGFGKPENLGKNINTEGRETFPFVSDSGVLYFASDGHPGLGGLDVFATSLEPGEAYIVNLGKPINSSKDDFSFIFNEEKKQGYFASDRDGGQGSDDIYAFEQLRPLNLKCTLPFSGKVVARTSGEPLSGVQLQIVDENGKAVAGLISGPGGIFNSQVSCRDQVYLIKASLEGYQEGSTEFLIEDRNYDQPVVELAKKAAETGTDLAVLLELAPIYFDLNKATIRPDAKLELNKIVDYLMKYPEVKIEVGSHTDSRGRDSYNLELSERRAASTVEYLISKGIDPERISGKGYGETQLVNQCEDGIQCSKEEHELNRRSEFIVVN